jgi:hypothetical protein
MIPPVRWIQPRLAGPCEGAQARQIYLSNNCSTGCRPVFTTVAFLELIDFIQENCSRGLGTNLGEIRVEGLPPTLREEDGRKREIFSHSQEMFPACRSDTRGRQRRPSQTRIRCSEGVRADAQQPRITGENRLFNGRNRRTGGTGTPRPDRAAGHETRSVFLLAPFRSWPARGASQTNISVPGSGLHHGRRNYHPRIPTGRPGRGEPFRRSFPCALPRFVPV